MSENEELKTRVLNQMTGFAKAICEGHESLTDLDPVKHAWIFALVQRELQKAYGATDAILGLIRRGLNLPPKDEPTHLKAKEETDVKNGV